MSSSPSRCICPRCGSKATPSACVWGVWQARANAWHATQLWRLTPLSSARAATSLDGLGVVQVHVWATEAVRVSSYSARRRHGARFALMAVRKMGHQTLV